MEIFTNSSGYAPLLVNLEPYFDKPFEELPKEVKEILKGTWFYPADTPMEVKKAIEAAYLNSAEQTDKVKEMFEGPRQIPWDNMDVEHRRRIAAQNDYQKDPKLEPATNSQLHSLQDELKEWIDKMERESEHAAAHLLSKAAGRIEAIIELDRERVGAEIQQLRKVQESEPQGSTKEKTFLNIIEALLALLLHPLPGTEKKPIFRSQEQLIDEIVDMRSMWHGISKRTLQGVFANAKKSSRDR